MIKRLTLIVALALALFSAPLEAGSWKTQDFGAVVDLVVGTSAVYDTSTTINPRDWDQIHFFVSIDVISGGGAGAGLVYLEGRTDTALAWVRCWAINYVDSCEVQNGLAFSSTVDVSLYGIVVLPGATSAALGATDRLVGGHPVNPLGFTELRAIVEDTNWNAAAVVEGYWLLKRE